MSIDKSDLIGYCINIVQERVDSLEVELENLKESAASDTKSSMGDKYETSREMINLEKGKISEQLGLAKNMLTTLKSIDPEKIFKKAELGALVITDKGKYFLSAALGQIDMKGEKYFAISMNSPLAQKLLNKKVGDTIQLGSNQQVIIEIE